MPSAYKYFGVVAETRPMREVKLGWGWMCMAGTMGATACALERFRIDCGETVGFRATGDSGCSNY